MATITGVLVNEGKDIALEKILNNDSTDRITIGMGLMVNSAGLSETSVFANIDEVTNSTNGYLIKILADGDWTLASNGAGLGFTASFAQQTFTASGGAFQEGGGDASVTGWYLYATKVAGATLLAYCYSGASQVVAAGESIKVTPSIKLEDGTNGVLTDEGAEMMLGAFLNDESIYNSTNVYIGLETTTLTEASVHTDVTPPSSAGGYAIQSPAFVVSGGSATTAATNEFDATGAAFSADIEGYTITSTGSSGSKLLAYDPESTAPITVADGDSYDVTIAI